MREKANYVTCPKGHKVFVIWSPLFQRFGFTCEECDQHSPHALSEYGVIEIRVKKEGDA